jgi:catechol 2,3-dioxygenase-like lactoylglutathione lyase family enzyme
MGIAAVRFYSPNISGAGQFHDQILRGQGTFGDEPAGKDPLKTPVIIFLRSGQTIALAKPLNTPPPPNLLAEVVFATDNLKKMKQYLAAQHTPITKNKQSDNDYFSVRDPEGHEIGFSESLFPFPSLTSTMIRIIHAGFVVHDRAAEDKFYKEILGFHVYWHGGMKDGEDNWVDMQVPDGTDWIEYMLGVSPSATHKTLGVMNHIALGVPDIHAAEQQLIKNGWKATEEPKIGRDGKWQLNLPDPDETRVELMEFKPTKEPCCSPYTGPHPGPQQ